MHYDDLIQRLRTATKLPLLQALMNEAADAIAALTAADVRPVVLCKDCYYADYSGMGNGTLWCNELERAMQETDFCSRGKREES